MIGVPHPADAGADGDIGDVVMQDQAGAECAADVHRQFHLTVRRRREVHRADDNADRNHADLRLEGHRSRWCATAIVAPNWLRESTRLDRPRSRLPELHASYAQTWKSSRSTETR